MDEIIRTLGTILANIDDLDDDLRLEFLFTFDQKYNDLLLEIRQILWEAGELTYKALDKLQTYKEETK